MENYLYEDLYHLEDQHWWHQAKRELVIESLQRFVSVKKSDKPALLDMGCGTGKNLEAFATLTIPSGIDMSAEALKFCRQRGLKKVYQGNIHHTEFKAASFDVITLLDVLEHTDEKPTLKEIYRLLKPGGVLIVTVPAFQWLWSKWDEVLHHKRRYTALQLNKVLLAHKFEPVKTSYVYSFLVAPALLIRWWKSLIYKNQDEYPSDFKLSSPLVNTFFYYVAKCERQVMWLLSLPFGTSVMCVARKK